MEKISSTGFDVSLPFSASTFVFGTILIQEALFYIFFGKFVTFLFLIEEDALNALYELSHFYKGKVLFLSHVFV